MTDRELDALVAEKVMGWTWDAECNCWAKDNIPRGYSFNPSTDISAAWEVVEKMTTDYNADHPRKYPECGFKLEYRTEQSESKVWACFYGTTPTPPFENMSIEGEAEDKSATRAICLAALKAVGHEITPP